MNGAREYATMFPGNQQIGKLFLHAGSHARGKIFHIYVLPYDTKITGMPWTIKGAVEVYGIKGGQNGWTEYYGWIHEGKWQKDFDKILKVRRKEIKENINNAELLKREKEITLKKEEQTLLSAY